MALIGDGSAAHDIHASDRIAVFKQHLTGVKPQRFPLALE
jgi:hypothetical protein